MTRVYDFFGQHELSLEAVAQTVSQLLGVEFVPGYSDYWGGDYYDYGEPESEHIRVVSNGPEDDPDDLPYEGFDDFPVIVEVNTSPRADQVRDLLVSAGFTHLRRKVTE